MKHTDPATRRLSSRPHPHPRIHIHICIHLGVPWQQVRLDCEHLCRDARCEAVHLPRVLLHLPGVEQRLEPAGLLRQLEQPLPLVLGQQRLLRRRPRRVLRLALLLPGCDLGLLTCERALVVLVVVELGVVVLDALEEQVACLLEERVDGEVERVVVGVERGLGGVLVLVQGRQARGEGELLLGRLCGQLVEERGEEVRVADGDGELDEDVRVPEAALLEAALVSIHCHSRCRLFSSIPLSCELALLVGSHEGGRQPVCAQVHGALGAPADIVDERDCLLVGCILVEVLILDGLEVDKVAHAGAGVPADVVGVHVDFAQKLDHLVAVCDVLLSAGSRSSSVAGRVALAIAGGGGRLGEGERVGDLEDAVLLHAHQASRRYAGERLAAGRRKLDSHL